MSKVVAIALSGGIDSAVAAYLLKTNKYDVFSITFILDEKFVKGFNEEKIENAKKISGFLGLKHFVCDLSDHFNNDVITYFKNEYINSRTPNPCAICNLKIKFDRLLEKAKLFGADIIATGHYASIVEKDQIKFIAPGRDKIKSQDYFLSLLQSETLKNIIFPLSDILKQDVEKIAENSGVPVKFNNESQDICFIKGQKYYSFLEEKFNLKLKPGNIIDQYGNILAQHRGLFKYTVGQRKNLGFSSTRPYYVIEIRHHSNELVVGFKEEVYTNKIIVTPVKWFGEDKKEYHVRIRYRHKPSLAEIIVHKNFLLINFKESQFAPAAGQIAAIYDNDGLIIGAGFIEKIK